MRILHVWDCAGVGAVLAKYQRQVFNHDVSVLKRSGFDRFGIDAFYQIEVDYDRAFMFKIHVLLKSRRYDVVHVHSLYESLPRLRLANPFKKIIMHYHGSESRNSNSKTIYNMLASRVLVSTRDLLYHHPVGHYLPAPVDIQHFNPDIRVVKNHKWLCMFDSGSFHTIKPQGFDVEMIDRKMSWVPYHRLPEFIAQYEGFVDVKIVNGKRLEALSTMGLQCLAMGLPVMRWDGEIIRGLPKEHYPENVVKRLELFYND